MKNKKAIIFFDGDCAFCNRFINYVVQTDKGFFQLSTQNSGFFTQKLKEYNLVSKGDDTIYVLIDEKFFKKSEAIGEILKRCDSKGKLLAVVLLLLPKSLADSAYGFFAKYRKKIMANNLCPLPNKEFLARLI